MNHTNQTKSRRVLIASSHPLFAQGLRRLLQKRQQADVEVLGVVATHQEALTAIGKLNPDLVIVDYDDQAVNREEFLAQFLEGAGRLRVVLLSLKEGGDQAVVYDRRDMPASQIDDWLSGWIDSPTDLLASGAGGEVPGKDGIMLNPTSLSARAGNSRRSDGMKHLVGAIVLVGILAVGGILALNNSWLLTTPASVQAGPVDQLFSYHWILISVLFALIAGFMLYSFVFFRRKKGDETDAVHIEGNNTLEITWTILPLITVLGFAVIGSQSLGEVLRVDPEAMEIKVVGQQWSWRYEYPEYGIVSTELILPINKQVLLVMESVDVLHSFWVPEFRIKQDLLPGRETFMRITPNRIGTYKVVCAEICGQAHTNMYSDVIVMGEAEFESWVFEQTDLPEDPVERGALYAEQYGCLACHSLDGTLLVGPTWQGVYESTVTLADGSTITADEAYLIDSIVNPNAQLHTGFVAGVMPQNFGEVLREDQIRDIVEFIKSLK